ncbi:MAG: hypothetical protein DU429_00210 [Candidatus Tokpelaia sp.]|nr:MAG: hypothetical protein DU430_04155 [Candidatus Tokpelaia sp.]KAA6207534.1 MAG: hypothetical protein DU429_00210 [Candidatus Tokpelaia sp.]
MFRPPLALLIINSGMTQNIFLQGRHFGAYHGQKVFLQLFLAVQIEARLTIFTAFAGVQIAAYGIIKAQQPKIMPVLNRHQAQAEFQPGFSLFIFLAKKRI